MKKWVCILLLSVCLNSCREAVPEQYVDMLTTIRIEPDYRDVTLSGKNAPMNFRILEQADSYLTCISGKKGEKLICRERNVTIDAGIWETLLEANRGGEIKFEIYLKKQGIWYKYPVIKSSISSRPVDGHLSCRLTEPL